MVREASLVIPLPYHCTLPYIMCNSRHIFSLTHKTTIYYIFILDHVLRVVLRVEYPQF
jgi:hypothetical protein